METNKFCLTFFSPTRTTGRSTLRKRRLSPQNQPPSLTPSALHRRARSEKRRSAADVHTHRKHSCAAAPHLRKTIRGIIANTRDIVFRIILLIFPTTHFALTLQGGARSARRGVPRKPATHRNPPPLHHANRSFTPPPCGNSPPPSLFGNKRWHLALQKKKMYFLTLTCSIFQIKIVNLRRKCTP